MIIIGFLIGFISTSIYIYIQKQLKKEHKELDHVKVALVLLALIMIFYLAYSAVGIITSKEYTNSKGQNCKGINYGMIICH